MPRPPDKIENLHLHAASKNGLCLSTKYFRNDTKYKWKCEIGSHPMWRAQWANIKRGRWCKQCAHDSFRFPFFKIQEIIVKHGGVLLTKEKEYRNTKTPLQYKCANNHLVSSDVARLRRIKKNKFGKLTDWCARCMGYEKWTVARVKSELEKSRNVELISTTIKDNKDNLEWKCKKCDYPFEMNIHNMTTGNQGCKYCSSGKSERRIRVFLEYIFQSSFLKAYPDWLINKQGRTLELDGYNEELKIAFEYQGPQHSQYDPNFFHSNGKHEFDRQQDNDRFKKRKCKEMGVLLIIQDCQDADCSVSDDEVFKNIISICKKNKLNIKKLKPITYKD